MVNRERSLKSRRNKSEFPNIWCPLKACSDMLWFCNVVSTPECTQPQAIVVFFHLNTTIKISESVYHFLQYRRLKKKSFKTHE